MLSEQPYLGHNGLVEGTYEKTVPRTPYVIVYRIDLEPRNELVILRAPHTSQERSHYEY
jgi:plasmid stabilization system protein ParE